MRKKGNRTPSGTGATLVLRPLDETMILWGPHCGWEPEWLTPTHLQWIPCVLLVCWKTIRLNHLKIVAEAAGGDQAGSRASTTNKGHLDGSGEDLEERMEQMEAANTMGWGAHLFPVRKMEGAYLERGMRHHATQNTRDGGTEEI